MNKKLRTQKYKYALALLIIILCILVCYSSGKRKIKELVINRFSTSLILLESKSNNFSKDLVSLQNNDNIQNGKILTVERISDYVYSRIYSNLRKNHFEVLFK